MSGFDTGGINWQINVQDGFTGPLTDFAALARQATLTAQAAARAQTQANRQQAQEQRELAARVRQQAQIERERARIFQTQRREAQQAQRAAAAALPPLRSLTNQFGSFQQALNSGTAAGNRLVFTLRNIIGVGAGLAAFQQVQGAFRGLVEAGIDFNRELEDSRVGIAGLLSATIDVFDAQGNLVTGAEAFNATQTIAIKQVDKLRQATLRTTATFQELADTFQVALAPGLKAGLDVDQIRELAVSVSQAAGALGVPTNQLSEEIRALLTGTIQARTTRIATALGIRPDDIARAKNDVGGLGKFLEDRFRAFEIAGERAAGTFSGSFRRARVAIALTAGDAAKPFFEEIRTTFLDVFDTFTESDPFGNLIPNEQAVKVLAAVFDGLADAVKTIRENAKQISFEDLLSAAQGLGAFFSGLGQALSGFTAGAINVISDLSRIFRQLFGGADIVKFSTTLGEIITAVGLVGAAFGLVHIGISTLILPLRTLNTAVMTVVATARLLTNPWTVVLGVILAASFAAESLLDDLIAAEQIKLAATDENQLSASARVVGEIAALEKDRNKSMAKILELQKTFGADGAVILDQELERNAKINAKIQERTKVLETLRQQEQGNRAQFDERAKPPEENAEGLLAKASAFVGNLLGAINEQMAAAAPVEVPIEDLTLTPQEQADLSVFRPATEEEKQAFKADLEFRSKAQLDNFGEALLKMADMTEAGLNLMKSAITEFGSFVADTMVDAFDPTNDTSFKERFARFLQSLARQIIATLTQIAVAKLLLQVGVGAAGGTTVAAGGGFVEAFADGGPVKGPRRGPYNIPRPASVPSSDTVAAWLTPGEFVQKASAVARYGADAMDALNSGLVDPASFRELLGLGQRRGRNFRRAKRIAFADGGLVAGQAAAVANTPGASSGGPTPAFIVGNDQAVDRFLRGGKAGFMDFVRENASSMKAILGQ